MSDEHYREIYGPGLERVLESIGADIDRVANAITPFTDMPGHDETGGTVGSLTEAVMGITAALVRIAHALEDVAGAVREGRE